MTIEKKTTVTFTATSLPGAPPRGTLAEAEADEARGVELAAFLAVLPTLTEEQRDVAQRAALGAALGAGFEVSRAWRAVLNSAQGAAAALITRDLITPEQFDTLTAPMRAAGVDFDGLVK